MKKNLEQLLSQKPRIKKKKRLTKDVVYMRVESPLIAKKAEPGQFVRVITGEKGEYIPLTIADSNAKKGTIDLVVKEIGKSTKELGTFRRGEELYGLAGPMGVAAEIKKYDKPVVCIGGGIGVAPLYPETKAFKEAGNNVISIIGAKTKKELLMKKKMKRASNELYIATDDGSKGFHGFVTGVLEEILKNHDVAEVVAIGPVPMMQGCVDVCKKYNVENIMVSLNPIMIDCTGMCGGCRVLINGNSKYACVDGPRFNGHEVNFPNLKNRQRQYLEKEKEALEKYCGGKE